MVVAENKKHSFSESQRILRFFSYRKLFFSSTFFPLSPVIFDQQQPQTSFPFHQESELGLFCDLRPASCCIDYGGGKWGTLSVEIVVELVVDTSWSNDKTTHVVCFHVSFVEVGNWLQSYSSVIVGFSFHHPYTTTTPQHGNSRNNNTMVFSRFLLLIYPFSQNHGSGKLPEMKGDYWRYIHFPLNHDYGRKGIFQFPTFLIK